ncbi:MAG: hypothetical protein MUE60_05845 [Candidatus Eisenbacteria bacterium]|jgi:hypothetical protein|nr:hypothetical protein [Candidatus Eisenbacteria bacterium]
MRRCLRGLAERTVLLVCSSVLALGAVELGLRWRFGRPLPIEGERIDLTKLGFRYGTPRVEKDSMVLRIVGIGDSFAFGPVQPTYNYHHVIQEELAARLGRPVEVINLGRPSIGPAAELTVLKDFALRFQPDIVLWTFFTGNDFTDDRPGVTHSLTDVLGKRHWQTTLVSGMPSPWYHRFRLSAYIRFLVAYGRHAEISGADREGNVTLDESAFLRVEAQRMAFLLSDTGVALAFRHSVRPRLDRAMELCESRGIPLVLAIAPDQSEVETALAEEVLRRLVIGSGLDRADGLAYGECLRRGDIGPLTVAHDSLATLSRDGVMVVDLLEAFRREGASGGLYIERHTHWNRAGNRLAAEVLVDSLVTLMHSCRGRR